MRRRIVWGLMLGLLLPYLPGCGGSTEPVNHPEAVPEGRVPIMPKDTPKAQPKKAANPAAQPKKK